jgi:peptidoglycan-associated lipoprotein
MALGESRGNAVRDFLIQEGVDGSLIEVVSYGEEQAASSGGDEKSWTLNRRVELK